MSEKKLTPDRMGLYLGKLRQKKGITLERLSEGLCGTDYLSRVETGQREAEKLLMDTLLERLGQPDGMFERILEKEEFEHWQMREQLRSLLQAGKLREVRTGLAEYRRQMEQGRFQKNGLQEQFVQVMELNLSIQEAVPFQNQKKEELQKFCKEYHQKVLSVIRLTQPRFGKELIHNLLISQNDASLVLAMLRLQRQLHGWMETKATYQELYRYLQTHFEISERVSLFPYLAYDMAEGACQEGNLEEALVFCQKALVELEEEKRLFGREKLMALKVQLLQALGREYQTAETELRQFQSLQSLYSKTTSLWIPYRESHDVHCVNQVLKSRRKLLGFSMAELAEGICDETSLWRIEQRETTPQREKRRALLQRVNLSGERYDYEIITEEYEDYLLRSRLGRAINTSQWEKASTLFSELKGHVPETKTNRQYLETIESNIRRYLPKEDPKKLSVEERIKCLKQTLAITLPNLSLEPEELKKTPAGMLSINETVILKQLASCYKEQERYREGLTILQFIQRCMEYGEDNLVRDEDLYTLCMVELVSLLGDCGDYEESNQVGEECLKLMFERQTNMRMAQCLFSMAWNWEQQASECSELEWVEQKEKCLVLLKMAYMITCWTKNTAGQAYLKEHCKKIYGVELES